MCKEFENEELELNEQESVSLEDLDKDELINIIYSLSEQKDKEIEKLNRKIGKLEAELEAAKKGNAQQGGNAICADVG